MALKLGRKPTAPKLLVYTHTKKHDGKTFINKKSKTLHDKITSRKEVMTQANEAIDENNLYFNEAGGKQRNGVYGLGSQACEYYGIDDAPASVSLQSGQRNPEEITELKQRIAEQDVVIKDLVDLTKNMLQRLDEMSGTQLPPRPPPCSGIGHVDDCVDEARDDNDEFGDNDDESGDDDMFGDDDDGFGGDDDDEFSGDDDGFATL